MKRAVSILLSPIIILGVSALQADAFAAGYPQSVGTSGGATGQCRWTLSGDGVLTISGSGSMADYTNGQTKPWGTDRIREIRVQDGVEHIGDYAFAGCVDAGAVELPNTLITIGENAFDGCGSLETIHIPDSVQGMKKGVFQNCGSLTTVDVSENVSEIFDYAFYNCRSLTTVSGWGDIQHVGKYAFYCCDNLTSFPFSEWLESVGNYAFSGCYALEGELVFHDLAQTIGDEAFANCQSLSSLAVGKNLTVIGEGAFGGCTGLESITVDGQNPVYDSRQNCSAIIETETDALLYGCDVTIIPDGVKAICDNAFANMGFESIVIPESVTEIGFGAFMSCFNLKSVTIKNSAAAISPYAFKNCTGLTVSAPDGSTAKTMAQACGFDFIPTDVPVVVAKGDANLDGEINIRDVTAIQRHIAEYKMLTPEQLQAADLNGDGAADINDATLLQMVLAEYDI